jgi:hypothetical protein
LPTDHTASCRHAEPVLAVPQTSPPPVRMHESAAEVCQPQFAGRASVAPGALFGTIGYVRTPPRWIHPRASG